MTDPKINSYVLKINGKVEIPKRLTSGLVIKQCETCDKDFVSKKCRNRRFCSVSCNNPRETNKHLYKRIQTVCIVCTKDFIVAKYRENTAKFCSRKCSGKFKVGKKLTQDHKKKISMAGVGKVMSASHRIKISESKKGEKSHFWKGGVTSENVKIRMSAKYCDWRTSVFKRDNWTCVWCGVKGCRKTPINADHIKPFSKFPELRFDLSNGRTLCVPCHRKTETYGRNK